MQDCIFCKIARREIAKEFVYEDEDIMVFPDINPQKPIHLLVIPKKHIEDFVDLDDALIVQKIWKVTQEMIGKYKLHGKGVRILVNAQGAQVVPHLHIHILGPVGLALKN